VGGLDWGGAHHILVVKLLAAAVRTALDTYTWNLGTSFDSDDLGPLEALTRDDLVQVVLLGFASPFDL
jgi:hypothetical protein